MPRIIRGNKVVDDEREVLHVPADTDLTLFPLPAGEVFFPLALWNLRRDEIVARGGKIGVWLDSHESPDALQAVEQISVIAVNFPKFTDGRGYSTARLLRERFGFTGEIRAVGDVLHDQLFYMQRCGFDAFAVRADKDIEAARQGLAGFPHVYQGAVDEALPIFRRRTA